MTSYSFNPLNAKLNTNCHLLALLGGATIVVVSRLRVNTNLLCTYQTTRRHIKEDRRIKDMVYYNCNNRSEI